MSSLSLKAAGYDRRSRVKAVWLVMSVGLLLLAVLTDILVGPAFLNVFDVLSVLLLPGQTTDPMVEVIVYQIRLPMTVMALVVGASLGIAGVQMQTILGNPLASPYTLGFSAAAGFGAAATILFGLEVPFLGAFSVPLAAFLSAACACALVYGVSQLRGVTADVMILAGIATLFLFQSLQSLIQYLAAPEVLQQIVFWLFGSLLKASWFAVAVSGSLLLVCFLLLLGDSWKLTALGMGDDRAQSLGVPVQRLRLKIFVIVSLLTAGAVAFVGTIGFVGLVAPHIARLLVGDDQRSLMPLSGVMGALIMVCASMASKLLSPGGVVPIGIVTAVVGVPFLFVLILKKDRRGDRC
ncbi:FecCD family ABC transporter permease [Rhodovibrionaceae bacterium A322]